MLYIVIVRISYNYVMYIIIRIIIIYYTIPPTRHPLNRSRARVGVAAEAYSIQNINNNLNNMGEWGACILSGRPSSEL